MIIDIMACSGLRGYMVKLTEVDAFKLKEINSLTALAFV